MDFHLQQIAVQHSECKFVHIHATKAPFFVEKLKIKTLLTLLIFKNGKAVERLIGFDGVSVPGAKNPDELVYRRIPIKNSVNSLNGLLDDCKSG
jgi:hypothetical protein